MSRFILSLVMTCLPLLVGWIQSPELPDDPTIAIPYQRVVVYAGPGDTHLQLGDIPAGVEIRISERNRVGNWVHVTREAPNGRVIIDGWILIGYLTVNDQLHLSEIPVNNEIPESDRITARYLSVAELYEVPVMPEVSPTMRDVYVRGQWLGNQSHVVTKIGDSVAANPSFLTPMSNTNYELGAYDFLADTVQYFGTSLAEESVAARLGMTTYVIFDPLWADKELCQPNESPLDCEYRRKKPSIAMIVFGPNDVRHMTDEEFGEQMRELVEKSLAKGVIPVLSTFSVHPDDTLWWQAINFNLRLRDIAAEYQVPLINLWAAARTLPEYGLDEDHVHLKNSGFRYIKFTKGNEAWYGVTLQNLLSIRMLDEIRRTLNME
ncbi:MAG: hypothetical protein K8L99_09790 [Anaerolineae bacterium]|nr:hypothetical protein [Anaerolineae bacterium]